MDTSGVQAQSVEVDTPDGPMRLYEARPPEGTEPKAAVVVIQEAFGVNDHIEDVTRRFAAAGYHAVAPELFHRSPPPRTAPYDDFSKVFPFYRDLGGDDAVLTDVDAARAHLHAAGWSDRRIGIVGFCFGGRVTLLASLRRPFGAGVGFYGGGIVSARWPQFPALIDEVPSLTVPWLGLFGDRDQAIPVEDVETLRAALTEAPAPAEVVRYPEAGHGFHCDQRPDHHEASARDAWSRTLAWFDTHLARSDEESTIHKSPFPDVEIPDLPLTTFVLSRTAERPDKAAFVDGPTGRVVTNAQFEDSVRRLAGGLLAAGMAKGEVLALMAPNCPEYGVVFHGVAMAGGAVTTINPTYTDREVHHQLVDAGATRLVTVPAFLETAAKAAEGTAVRETFVLGDPPEGADGVRPLTALFGEPLAEHVPVATDDVVVLPYSSGTTGLSKGVMLTHRNLVANIVQSQAVLKLDDDESFVAVLPFFHIYGMQVLMNMGLAGGATIVTMPRFDLEQFLALHQEHGLTRAFVAPPMVVALAKHPLVDQYDLSKLRMIFSGAAPLSAELALECGARLDCEVVQGYGMTELSPVTHATPPGDFVPGSVGVAIPNTETRIVDPATGEDLGLDEDGEVWVRGPQVMKGYLNNEEATRATIDDEGWLHTGDIGHVNADGHLFVVDRLKELIKYKGFQVPPAELEALLLTHPAVADAAVIGVPDEEAGEIPAAFVVLKPGADATAPDIQGFVADRVASYKQIRRLTFVDQIPKSPSGKILRRLLR